MDPSPDSTPGAGHYDAIVVGAGQAGGPLATALARAGRRTALIERQHVGGTCINEGCTPTKTMVASARVAYLARRAADFGVRTGTVSVDMAAVRQRKRDIVTQFRSGSRKGLEAADGLDLLFGSARFSGPRQLEVELTDGGTAQLSADLVFINTGARPSVPPIPGLDEVSYVDSTSIMELDQVPDHLLVLGGGYIGVEFAQMFRRFGSRVTIVDQGPQLLAREDADIADAVREILVEDGIEVLGSTEVGSVKVVDGEITLEIAGEGGDTVAGSHLLVATGRIPNTEALKLEAAGVETDRRGPITVNDRLETSASGVFALGDVKGGPAFTHISYDDFRVIRTNLLEQGSASIADRLVPFTLYTDPQLGRIGMTEGEALDAGHEILVARMPMQSVARALEMDESRGLMKVIVDARTDLMLGAAILGVEGGEMMSTLQMAMLGGLPYTALRDAVFAHPTLAESFNNLFGTLDPP
jgi:pyruvate/2-oxoglutarate dehydrogenase complex dihydrolipoamide dehydrogenase (E3) component